MVSVASASCYMTSVSSYHPRYQSRSSMYIRGLIPQMAVPILNIIWPLCLCLNNFYNLNTVYNYVMVLLVIVQVSDSTATKLLLMVVFLEQLVFG